MFLQLFSRTGQFLPLPLALPGSGESVWPLPVTGSVTVSDSRCSKHIVIVNQSRRVCHFLAMFAAVT